MIEVSNLDKFYGKFQALKNINVSVAQGERVVICGPSGSGKSTLIRCFNGLENHDAGKRVVDGIELYEGSPDTVDGIYVSDSRWTHAGANLCDGYFEGKHIECPLHQG